MCVIAGNTLSFPIHWFHICPMKVRGSNLQGCHKHEIRQCAQGLVLRSAQYSSEHQLCSRGPLSGKSIALYVKSSPLDCRFEDRICSFHFSW